MENKQAKTFLLTGMNDKGQRVKRQVVAMTKNLAIQAAKRAQIMHTVMASKEIKNA